MAIATWGRSLAGGTAALAPTCRTGDEAIPEKPSRPPHRQLARDAATGRTGEIMHIARLNGSPSRVWLRPVGGGKEWIAAPDDVRLIPADTPVAEHD